MIVFKLDENIRKKAETNKDKYKKVTTETRTDYLGNISIIIYRNFGGSLLYIATVLKDGDNYAITEIRANGRSYRAPHTLQQYREEIMQISALKKL